MSLLLILLGVFLGHSDAPLRAGVGEWRSLSLVQEAQDAYRRVAFLEKAESAPEDSPSDLPLDEEEDDDESAVHLASPCSDRPTALTAVDCLRRGISPRIVAMRAAPRSPPVS